MIHSNASVRPPYVYGEILSRSLCQSPQSELPGFGTFVSQGMVVGAFIAFLFPVLGMLLDPRNGYNFLLISWLPVFLLNGLGFGLFEGAGIWAYCYIAGHRLKALARAVVGIIVLTALFAAFTYFYTFFPLDYGSVQHWLPFVAFYIAIGAVFGLVCGSKFSPIRELMRGTTPPRWVGLNGITGFLLRVLITYATMESTLWIILMIQRSRSQSELAFAAIAFGHCAAAIVILFTRMPFWLLLPLALLINFPVVVLITDVLTKDIIGLKPIIIAYLTLWAAFLLCRVSMPHAVLSFLKKEIRYYLID